MERVLGHFLFTPSCPLLCGEGLNPRTQSPQSWPTKDTLGGSISNISILGGREQASLKDVSIFSSFLDSFVDAKIYWFIQQYLMNTVHQDMLNPTAVGLQSRLRGLICPLLRPSADDTLSYGYQGCSSVCFPLMLFNPAVTLEERCCNDSPFCNKF